MRARQRGAGFTLVELIVVITIVGILSTIGFVSYSNYLTGARDSNRISQMIKLSDALQVYGSNKSLPLPDDYISIIASGATNVTGYQGDLGVDVLETLDYSNGGIDPKDDAYFTYAVDKGRSVSQILTFMEEAGGTAMLTNQSYAVDYSERYPRTYGKKLGIFLYNVAGITKNTPAHQLSDLIAATRLDSVLTGSGFDVYFSDTEKLSGTGLTLRGSIPDANCKRIKETGGGGGGSGIYSINPAGAGARDVYCEMEEAGGGWTLMGRSVTPGGSTITAGTATGSLTDLTKSYSATSANLSFSQIMLGVYTTGRTIDSGMYKTVAGTTITFTASGHTLAGTGITGGIANDGYNAKQGMIFVK